MLPSQKGLLAFAVGCAAIAIAAIAIPQAIQAERARQADIQKAAVVAEAHRGIAKATAAARFRLIQAEAEIEEHRRRQTEKMFEKLRLERLQEPRFLVRSRPDLR
jgi:hypothetical protein